MKLIINIPAYNEGDAIGKTIKSIPRKFEGISEVLVQVINDGSKDNTVEVAKKSGADIVVSHSTNRRLGAVFNTAVESALKNNADFMVNIDADGQFDVNEIKNVLAPVLNNEADMVIGDRFNKGKAHNIPFIKSFFNKVGAKLVGIFLGIKTDDLTCGFRAHNREVLLRLNRVSGFTYTQETIIDAIGKNLKLKWVPVTVHYFEGRKSRIVKSVFSFINNSAKIIIKAIRDVRPMKFFGIPGTVLMILSLGFFITFLSFYFQDFKISPYKNWLLVSITLFLIGLQFIVFALIADMIKGNRKMIEDQMYMMKKEKYRK